MFRRTLTALAVAVGVAAGATIAAPALAAPPPTSAAPSHVKLPPYPATVPTFTSVWAPAVSGQGAARLFVRVFSGAGTPTGRVTVAVAGRTQTVPLRHGSATATVGRLAPGAYPVVARYTPTAGSRWKASSAGTTLVVRGAATRTSVFAPTIRAGQAARITARVSAAGGARPAGVVTFSVAGQRHVARVVNGSATVSVRGLSAGTYLVTATFRPSDGAVLGSSGRTTLTVRRAFWPGWHGVSFRWGFWPGAAGWWWFGGRSGVFAFA
jgi:hypothetical protein